MLTAARLGNPCATLLLKWGSSEDLSTSLPRRHRRAMFTGNERAAVRRRMSACGTLSPVGRRAERDSSAQVFQTSIFSAISRASSTSTPRYRTVLSIFVWPRSS